MSINSYSKDNILTIQLLDERLMDKLFDIETDETSARKAFTKRGLFG